MAFKDFRPGATAPGVPVGSTKPEQTKRRSFRDFAPAPDLPSPDIMQSESAAADPDSGWTIADTPPFAPDLSSRPWWQKAVDTVVPGAQFRPAEPQTAPPPVELPPGLSNALSNEAAAWGLPQMPEPTPGPSPEMAAAQRVLGARFKPPPIDATGLHATTTDPGSISYNPDEELEAMRRAQGFEPGQAYDPAQIGAAPPPDQAILNVPSPWSQRPQQASPMDTRGPEIQPERQTGKGTFEGSFIAGVGDTVATAGQALEWLGGPTQLPQDNADPFAAPARFAPDKPVFQDTAKTLQQKGKELQDKYGVKFDKPTSWRNILDPEWWASDGARMLPTTLALIPASLVGGWAGGTAATAWGLGTAGRLILQAAGGALLSRPVEAALEAGGIYAQAKEQGMTEEQANTAANRTFAANLPLVVADFAELAAAFAPMGKLAKVGKTPVMRAAARVAGTVPGKIGMAAGKLATGAVAEGEEEAFQAAAGQAAIASVQGKPYFEAFVQGLQSPEAQQGRVGGWAMGALFPIAGTVKDIYDGSVAQLPPEIRQQVETAAQQAQQAGVPEQSALLQALDQVAETPEGAQAIQQAVQATMAKQEQPPPQATQPAVISRAQETTPVTQPVRQSLPIEVGATANTPYGPGRVMGWNDVAITVYVDSLQQLRAVRPQQVEVTAPATAPELKPGLRVQTPQGSGTITKTDGRRATVGVGGKSVTFTTDKLQPIRNIWTPPVRSPQQAAPTPAEPAAAPALIAPATEPAAPPASPKNILTNPGVIDAMTDAFVFDGQEGDRNSSAWRQARRVIEQKAKDTLRSGAQADTELLGRPVADWAASMSAPTQKPDEGPDIGGTAPLQPPPLPSGPPAATSPTVSTPPVVQPDATPAPVTPVTPQDAGRGTTLRAQTPSLRTYDEAQAAIDAFEDELEQKYGEEEVMRAPMPSMYTGAFAQDLETALAKTKLTREELDKRDAMYQARDAFEQADDKAALNAIMARIPRPRESGELSIAATDDMIRKALADIMHLTKVRRFSKGGQVDVDTRAFARELYVKLSHALAAQGKLPQDFAGDLEHAMSVAQNFQNTVYGVSPEPLLRQVRNITEAIFDGKVETGLEALPAPSALSANAIDRDALYRELYPAGSDKARESVVGSVWPKYAEDKALLDHLFKNANADQRSVILKYQQQMKAATAAATTPTQPTVPSPDKTDGVSVGAGAKGQAQPQAEKPGATKRARDLPPTEPLATGNTTTAKTERGTSVTIQYAVVDVDSLVASHDTALKVNPAYPQELQPRDRGRVASEDQVNRIATTLDPEFLGESPKASDGAPIIGPDGVVESGNGRVIAMQRVYGQKDGKTAQKYRAWLLENAERFGLDKTAIEGAEAPVLVRIRQTEVDRAQFAAEANEQATAALSATEQAAADAKKLTGGMMALFNPTESGDLLHPGNRDFIRAFFDKVIGATERGRYMTEDGAISQEGVTRIRNAVFAMAYGDTAAIAKLAESTDNNVRNITNGMLIAAGRIAQVKEGIAAGRLHDVDLSGEIASAMRKLSQLRENGESVEKYLAGAKGEPGGQVSLFGADLDSVTLDVLDIFNRNKASGKKVAAILTAYADAMEQAGDPRQATFFKADVPTKADILEAAIRRAARADASQATLFEGEPDGGAQVGAPAAPARPGAEPNRAAGGQGSSVQAKGDVSTPPGKGELGFPAGAGRMSTAATAARLAAPAKAETASRTVTEPTKQNIINFIGRTFQVPVRQGRIPSDAAGLYKVKPEVIRVRGKNLMTHAHELGHHLDKVLGLSKDGRFDEDLMPLGQALYPNETNTDTLRKEGIAEFMRMFISHPQSAYDAAPEYARELKRVLDDNPDIGQGIGELRKLYLAYSNLDPQQHIRAGIAPHKPPILKRLRETLNPARLASTTYASAVDEYSPILAAENAILAGAKMPQSGRLADVPLSVLRAGARLRRGVAPTDSAYKTLWRARGIEGRADRWILGDGRDDAPGGPVAGKTLQQLLVPVKDRMDDFRDYIVALKASRAQELGLETGFDADKVQAVLKKLGSPVFRKTADELAAFRRASTRELVKAGILDAETVKGWEERWPHPFPFYRDMGEGQPFQGGGKKAVNIGKPVKTMKGSERAIIDPIQSIIRDTYHYFKLAEMNRAAQNMVKAAGDAEGMGWLVEKVPNPMEGRQFKLEEIQRFLDPAVLESEAFDPAAVATIFRAQRVAGVKEAQEKIATVWMDGKPVFYQFNPDIYDALFKVGPQFGKSTEWIVTALRPFARVLRSSVTLGIEFAGRNVMRDSQETWIYSKAGVTPWDTMTAGFELLTRQLTGKRMPDDFWQAKGAGAFFKAAIVSMDRDYQAMSIDQLLGDKPGRLQQAVSFVTQPAKMPSRMFHALESFSEFFENINRYAEVRKMGRKLGWDKQSAMEIALAGRDVTIDFGRSGNRTDLIKATTAFWNAQVQGLDKFVRAHKENPGRTVLRALLYVTIPTLLHYLWVKDDPDYEEQPRWMKDAFYLIPAGKKADGHTRFVPFPRVFAPLGLLYGVLPLRMMEYLETHDKRAADELATRLWELAPLPMPTLIGVINGVWNNRGWWGGPIVPREEERYEAAEQYGAGTSEFAKQIGKAAGVSPRKVDYVITGLSGYLGKYTTYGLDKLAVAVGVRPDPPEGDAEDMPVLRAFLKSGVGTSSESLNRFYEEKDALEREYNTMRKKADEGFYDKMPPAEKTELVARATEMQAKRTAMNAVARSLSDLRRLRTDLDEGTKTEMQAYSPPQRRKIIDAIDTLRANIARAYYQKADMLPADQDLQKQLLEYIK